MAKVEATKEEVQVVRKKLREEGLKTKDAELIAKLIKLDESKRVVSHKKALGKAYISRVRLGIRDMIKTLTEHDFDEAQVKATRGLAKLSVGGKPTAEEERFISKISKELRSSTVAKEKKKELSPEKLAQIRKEKEERLARKFQGKEQDLRERGKGLGSNDIVLKYL